MTRAEALRMALAELPDADVPLATRTGPQMLDSGAITFPHIDYDRRLPALFEAAYTVARVTATTVIVLAGLGALSWFVHF